MADTSAEHAHFLLWLRTELDAHRGLAGELSAFFGKANNWAGRVSKGFYPIDLETACRIAAFRKTSLTAILASDLSRHETDQESKAGGSDVPASARRLAELETRIKDYEAVFREMQHALGHLGEIAVRLHEIEHARRPPTARSKHHRKTG